MRFGIVFYDRPDGSEPVREFLDGLNVKMRAKMVRTIELLAANGPELREPYSKPVGDGMFELRVRLATDSTRILYFFDAGQRVVLAHGFVKKTDKIPQGHLDMAMKYRAEYMAREEL